MKRIFGLILVLVMIFSTLSVQAENESAELSGSCGENLTWTYEPDAKVLTISGTGEMDNYLGNNSDYGKYIPYPWDSFRYVIEHVVVQEGVTSIGDEAFNAIWSIKSVELPSGITKIGFCAFTDCIELERLDLPSGLKTIDDYAFNGCRKLSGITIPDGIESIGEAAFAATAITELVIPDSLDSIGRDTFGGTPLESVDLGSVTTIGGGAFANCEKLKSITIPATVSSIGENVFSGTFSLESIEVAAENEHYKSIDGVLFSADGTRLLFYPTGKTEKAYTVPASVTTLHSCCFYNCGLLENIYLPQSLTTIESRALAKCRNLKSLSLPEGVSTIEYGAFSGCASMESFTFGKGLSRIESDTFERCIALKSIDIPEGVTSIGWRAFEGCWSLKDMSFPSTLTLVEGGAIAETWLRIPTDEFVVVGGGVLLRYNGNDKNVVIPDGICCISDAFEKTRNSEVESITMPDSVKYIGTGAFANLPKLKSSTLSKSLTVLPRQLFKGCSSLESITLHEGLESIGDDAFGGCTSLKSLVIPDSVTSVGYNVISSCMSLRELKMGTGLTEISSSFGWSGLTTVVIGPNVKSIGIGAFSSSPNLVDVVIPAGVEKIDAFAFENCEKLRRVYFEGEPPLDAGFMHLVFGDTSYFFDISLLELDPTSVHCPYTIFSNEYCECHHEIAMPNIELFYNPEYASSWSPNGETRWGACSELHSDRPFEGYKISPYETFTVSFVANGEELASQSVYGGRGITEFPQIPPEEGKIGFWNNPCRMITADTVVEPYYQATFIVTDGLIRVPLGTSRTALGEALNLDFEAGEETLKTGDILIANGKEYTLAVTGDINGDGQANAADASMILREQVRLCTFGEVEAVAATINADIPYSSADAASILRYVVRLIPVLGPTLD